MSLSDYLIKGPNRHVVLVPLGSLNQLVPSRQHTGEQNALIMLYPNSKSWDEVWGSLDLLEYLGKTCLNISSETEPYNVWFELIYIFDPKERKPIIPTIQYLRLMTSFYKSRYPLPRLAAYKITNYYKRESLIDYYIKYGCYKR
jgi:hypothetical protein